MLPILVMLVIGLPWLGALLVWWAGDQRSRQQHALAVGFSVVTALAALALIPFSQTVQTIVIPSSGVSGNGYGTFTFSPDGLGIFLAVVATVIGSLAVIFSVDYMKGEAQLGRYYSMVLFFIGAMAGLVLTSNLLLIFVFWEITALCSYALISFYNDDPKAVAGGMKALIMTQLGGVGLLLGAALSYGYLHTVDLNEFLAHADQLPADVLSVMAFGFLIAAAAKSAQFPFQTWLPDAMEAPTPVSALIHAATMVNAGVYLLARFFPAFADVPYWRDAVMLVGMLSALLSAIMALVATDLKRVLAYSTVSQLGYMVYAVGAGGVFASQFHLLSHAVFKALLFLSAGAIIHSVGTRDMRGMGGLGKEMPAVRVVFLIGAAALAGLPILNGFWSKELVLEAGLEGGPLWMWVVMLIGAGLTALYTMRCVWMVFYAPPANPLRHIHDAGPAMRSALFPLAIGTLTTWLLAGPFSEFLKGIGVEEETTLEIVMIVLREPATWLAVGVVILGLLAWWQRKYLQILTEPMQDLGVMAERSFGFEAINRTIVQTIQGWAEDLRGLQTGLLSWNVLAIIVSLVMALLIVALGAV